MIEIYKILKRFQVQSSLNTERCRWQSQPVDQGFIECTNFFYKIDCTNWSTEKAKVELQPQFEWCEAHFAERIGGIPVNPPPSHKMWNCKTEAHFSKGTERFSHTYPERFWPKTLMSRGIRFETADYNSLLALLKKDLYTRQAYLPIFFNEDLSAALENERVPCTLGYYFYYKDEKIHCNYVIRSIDVIRHLNNDLYLTFLLLENVAKQISQPIGNITLIAFNMHCFQNDRYTLAKRIEKYENKS